MPALPSETTGRPAWGTPATLGLTLGGSGLAGRLFAALGRRLGGGLAGHNGLRSIAQHLGTNDFLRLRIGVGRPGRGDPRPVADYVLSPFDATFGVEALVARAADAVEQLATDGLEATQRAVN